MPEVKMNRREFLKLSAMFTLASATSSLISCDNNVTNRYVRPEPIIHPEGKLLLTNANIIDVRNGDIIKGQILIQNKK